MNTKIMFSKIASAMTIFMMVLSMVGFSPAQVTATELPSEETEQSVVLISYCHLPSGDEDKGQLHEDEPESSWNGHKNHEGDFLISDEEGKTKSDCEEMIENDSDDEENSNDDCAEFRDNNEEEGDCDENGDSEESEYSEAQISATKILCPSEDLLPNWGNYGDDITATTADEFLNTEGKESCEEVDWTFEWSIGAPYVDDNTLTGGDDWTSFENGTTIVPAGENIGIREQMPEGYTPFTGQNTDQDESAELYCGNDVLNYDNLEYINTLSDQTYHCVAFNAHDDMCANVEGIQTEVPKGMETDGDYCYTPEQNEGGICEDDEDTYESVYVSDSTTLVGANPSAVLSFIHDAWTAAIPDASWIWSTNPVTLVASVDEVETFTKTFEVTGTPTSASLEIAADNDYSVELNGDPLCADNSGGNFSSTDTCIIDVNNLLNGTNTLLFTVTNKEIADNLNPQINPAGLKYKLSVNGDCATCEMEEGWDVDYYNYTQYDTGMNLPVQQWFQKSTYGNPLSADNTFSTNADAWTGWSYGNDKYEFSQVENDLMFGGNNFFPFDSGAGLPYSNESLVFTGVGVNNVYTYVEGPTGTDYHFGLHATGYVEAPADGDYAFTLASDDDVWVYVDGVLVVDNSGVHGTPGTVTGGNIALEEGINKVELFYAERHGKQAALNFEFTDKELVIMTTEDCLPPPPVMCMDDNANNYNQPLPCTYDPEPVQCDARINLVQNGGFESPVLDSGTWDLFEEGDLMGWILDWIYDSEGTPTLEIQNNVAGADFEGNQHAELDGNHPVGIYQVIETIPGETYDFSYAYSARPGRDAEDNRIWARVDNYADATLYSADHAVDATYATDTNWTTYSTSFVADSETTIMFHDMGTDTSFGGYIDGVSLTCNPEPEVEMCEWNENIPADSEDCNEPIDMCPGEEYPGIQDSYYDCMYIVDMCSNIDGNQSQVPEGYTLEGDSTCVAPEETPNRSSSGSRSGSRSGGSVLGASTDMCAWNASFMRKGWHGNKTEDVKTVQNFLNQFMTSGLIVDGIFGLKTEAAVKAFQAKYADDILKPWGINSPTGLFYLSTLTKAKEITCAVDENLPTLINWSANPTVR